METAFELRCAHSTRAGLDHDLLEAGTRPFDLTCEIPIRAHLFEVEPDEAVLLLSIHHVAADGWSLGVISRDLVRARKFATE